MKYSAFYQKISNVFQLTAYRAALIVLVNEMVSEFTGDFGTQHHDTVHTAVLVLTSASLTRSRSEHRSRFQTSESGNLFEITNLRIIEIKLRKCLIKLYKQQMSN